MMARADFQVHFGSQNICRHVSDALERARELQTAS